MNTAAWEFVDWTPHPMSTVEFLYLGTAVAAGQRLEGRRRLETLVSAAASLQWRDEADPDGGFGVGVANGQVVHRADQPRPSAPNSSWQEKTERIKIEMNSSSRQNRLTGCRQAGEHRTAGCMFDGRCETAALPRRCAPS